MKIKYLMIATLIALFSVGMVSAEDSFTIPKSGQAVMDMNLKSSGVEIVKLVTSTDATLVTDLAGETVLDGQVYWVAFSSNSDLHVVMRDTDTANLSSTQLLPLLGIPTSPFIMTFDPPVPFTNSLSVNLGAAGSTPTADDYAAIGIRKRR